VDRVRLYRTEAIVLRRSNFGEADRLLTLYTPEWGKLRVIAKGVRKPTSRKSGHLELFTHSRLLVAKGRNLDIVTQAETLHSFRPLREDLLRTGWAYYAAELLDRFVEEGIEDRPLFNLFLATLGWLCEDVDLDLTNCGFWRWSAIGLNCFTALPARQRSRLGPLPSSVRLRGGFSALAAVRGKKRPERFLCPLSKSCASCRPIATSYVSGCALAVRCMPNWKRRCDATSHTPWSVI